MDRASWSLDAASPSTSVPTGRAVKAGDLVIIDEGYQSLKVAYVDPKKCHNTRDGSFLHKDFVGRPFGSRAYAKGSNQAYLYLLAPTPELWTQVLRHRTQILYAADIALVCAFLELRPGCTVLESGTGSASLTHALARAVAPHGHVHTFEFHELRANEAGADLRNNGLGELVTVRQRNVEEQGFPAELAGRADAVFLDLPGPWKAVTAAAACLRSDGVFCSFSPCIEQVQKTAAALAGAGFAAPRTMECLLREYEIQTEALLTNLDNADAGKKRKRKPWQREGPAGAADQAGPDGMPRAVLAKPLPETRGHTGYLTFARRLPVDWPIAALRHGGHLQTEPG
ncbi:hypothetical protein WJX81_000802 [Elliptochloris bilobata]|uniref:tRNA (adenine(58)-N(1))-methyltransferase n=1 Tax=Elliptochloris bilobata TaxID=381761 RepID=A0AAW1QXY4_9CHLO